VFEFFFTISPGNDKPDGLVISGKDATGLPTVLIFLWLIELLKRYKMALKIEEKTLASDTSS
jgi:hypothetical protein